MAKPIKAKPIFVRVNWNDAQGSATKAFTIDNVPHEGIIMHTYGWLVEEDDKGVSVANEDYFEENETWYRGHTFIPREIVLSVDPIRLTTARKRKVDKSPPDVI